MPSELETDSEKVDRETWQLYIESKKIANAAARVRNGFGIVCLIVNAALIVCGLCWSLDLPIPRIERYFTVFAVLGIITNISRLTSDVSLVNSRLLGFGQLLELLARRKSK